MFSQNGHEYMNITPLYHLNNIIIIFVLIYILKIIKVYNNGGNLKDLKVIHVAFDQASKIFSIFTIGYILIVYAWVYIEYNLLQKNPRVDINAIIIDFSFDAIGLPDWKISNNLSELNDKQILIIEHQIAEAFKKKLLICRYQDQNKTVRFFWYDPEILNKIEQPGGDFYKKYWDNHPLQRLEGRTGKCPGGPVYKFW